MGQLIAAAAYNGGQRVMDISIEEGRSWAQQPGHFVWIGFHEPNRGGAEEIQAQFDLHPLAVEDALHAHQRPKLELYGDSLFVVLRTAQLRRSSRSARPTSSPARASSSRSATAPRRPTRRCASAASPALGCCVMARTTSSTPSSISWSTTTCPSSRRWKRGGGSRTGAQGPGHPRRHRTDLPAAPRAASPAPHGGADDRGVPPAGASRAAVHRRRHPALFPGRDRSRAARE